MSKQFVICLLSLAVVFLCACSDNISDDLSEISQIEVYNNRTQNDNKTSAVLTQNDMNYFQALWENADWTNGMYKFNYDYTFEFNDKNIKYSFLGGAFYDADNDCCFEVSDEQRDYINSLLVSYCITE